MANFKLKDAIKNRDVIYSGGGSTYAFLREPINEVSDVRHRNANIWEGMGIEQMEELAELCPVISTALGLSIHEDDDNVKISSLNEFFNHIEYVEQEEKVKPPFV